MIITDITGQSEMLTDYKDVERVQRVNGEHLLSFFVPKTEQNSLAFDLLQEESVIEYEGHEYRVKTLQEYTIGGTPVKRIERAQHVFFDIIDNHQYEKLSGSINAVRALNHIFDVTDWTWINHGAFNSVEFDNFGDDNALSLFTKFLERYGAEFEITGPREITLKNQIGELKDEQFRYQYNIKTLSRNVDTTNLSTYIKGFGKKVTDESGNVISEVVAEYTSPNASIYGIRHAPPVNDERFTTVSSLQQHLQKIIKDTPKVSIEIEVVHLGMDVQKGDRLYLIYEPLQLDLIVRVMEYRDYPESFKSPVVVLSNIMQTATDRMVSIEQVKKNVNQLTDADGNLSLKLKRLYSDTNIYHDNTGSWYISPEDANRFVHLGSGGLDVHRGLIRVEREDGYALIIGGKANFDLMVQGGTPQSIDDEQVYNEGQYTRTASTEYVRFDFLRFAHTSRFLNLAFYAKGGGSGAYSYVQVQDSDGSILDTKFTNNGVDTNIGMSIDLGVPTGEQKLFYVLIKTTNADYPCNVRLGTKYLSG